METPQPPQDQDKRKPPLPRRNSGQYVEEGLGELESYANNRFNHDPEALTETDNLNVLYHMPSRRAE